MFAARIVQVLRRQFVLAAIGLILTGVGAAAVFRSVPPSYSLTATVLLLPPAIPDAKTGQAANPYLQLGGLTGPAEILARALNDPTIKEVAVRNGLTTDYEVARDYLTSAPVVLVTVEDQNLVRARATRDWLLGQVPKSLQQLQAAVGVPASAMVTSIVISTEGEVGLSSKTTLRLLLLAVAGGLLVTLAAATLLDTVNRERLDTVKRERSRRGSRRARGASMEALSRQRPAVDPARVAGASRRDGVGSPSGLAARSPSAAPAKSTAGGSD